MTIILKLF